MNQTRQRSNTIPIGSVEIKRKYSDSCHIGTTPTNTPSTPLFSNISSHSFSNKQEFYVGSLEKISNTKLFEIDRLK